MAKKRVKQDDDQLSFEETLERLGRIVETLEGRQGSLDESLAGFEEGVKLIRRADALLSKAEQRIRLLTDVDEDGRPIAEEMAEGEFASDAAAPGRRRTASKPIDDDADEVPFDV